MRKRTALLVSKRYPGTRLSSSVDVFMCGSTSARAREAELGNDFFFCGRAQSVSPVPSERWEIAGCFSLHLGFRSGVCNAGRKAFVRASNGKHRLLYGSFPGLTFRAHCYVK